METDFRQDLGQKVNERVCSLHSCQVMSSVRTFYESKKKCVELELKNNFRASVCSLFNK